MSETFTFELFLSKSDGGEGLQQREHREGESERAREFAFLFKNGSFGLLGAKDWLSLSETSKEMHNLVASLSEWTQTVGFQLLQAPKQFCPLAYAIRVRQHSSSSTQTWASKLLLGTAVNEQAAGGGTRTLRPMLVFEAQHDAVEHWKGCVDSYLRLSQMPTAQQLEDTTKAVRRLITLGTNPTEAILGTLATAKEKKDGGPKLNKIVGPWIISVLLGLCFGSSSPSKQEKEWIESLIVSCGASSVRALVMFYAGCGVDDIHATTKSTGLKKSLPRWLRAMILGALAKCSWLSLQSDVLGSAHLCFFKALFKSIHAAELLRTRMGASNKPHLAKVFLLVCIVRGAQYPSSEEEFVQLEWASLVSAPLKRICTTDSLFELTDSSGGEIWFSEVWQPSLAGRSVPKPGSNTPAALICRMGNDSKTWDKILALEQVTAPQILANISSLVYLSYPVETLEAYLVPRSAGISSLDLLKIRYLLLGTFKPGNVASAVSAVSSTSTAPLGDSNVIKVNVGVPRFVADKKGQTTQIETRKNVSRSFGMSTVHGFLNLVESMIEARMPLADGEKRKAGVGILSFTEELKRNHLRSGIPPSSPPYCARPCWRGETVCLEQLGGENAKELLMGIHWCEQQGASSCDLDLSIMLYAENWQPLTQVSYTNLEIEGVTHSGDQTSAPCPEGARETVIINFPKLAAAYPQARYVVMMVFSFSRTQYQSLHEASAFVADPHMQGDGPGGSRVLTGSNLTGDSNGPTVAAYLELNENRRFFTFCCQQVNNSRTTAHESQDIFGTILSKMVEARKGSLSLPLYQVGAFHASSLCDSIIVLTHQGTTPEVVVHRDEGESCFSLFVRVLKILDGIRPGAPNFRAKAAPRLSSAAGSNNIIYYFGGELDPWAGLLRQPCDIPRMLVNLRSAENESKVFSVGEAPMIRVNGADVAEMLSAST